MTIEDWEAVSATLLWINLKSGLLPMTDELYGACENRGRKGGDGSLTALARRIRRQSQTFFDADVARTGAACFSGKSEDSRVRLLSRLRPALSASTSPLNGSKSNPAHSKNREEEK